MISAEQKRYILKRARNRCEYCISPMSHAIQAFNVEHIIPEAKGGTDDLDNLASACGGCNGHKYIKTHAFDPFDNQLVPLYHPRLMSWQAHFIWSDDYLEIVGISPTGRATVKALNLNRFGVVNLRRSLLLEGLHPPEGY
jgi:hypothetical protein